MGVQSIRPKIFNHWGSEVMSGESEPMGEVGERIETEEEAEFVRDLKDPKLP